MPIDSSHILTLVAAAGLYWYDYITFFFLYNPLYILKSGHLIYYN